MESACKTTVLKKELCIIETSTITCEAPVAYSVLKLRGEQTRNTVNNPAPAHGSRAWEQYHSGAWVLVRGPVDPK